MTYMILNCEEYMDMIYTEENGQYIFDCSSAIWSTDSIHDCYQGGRLVSGNIGFLCDVDFVIESPDYIILVEYKNANIAGASNPGAFNPAEETKLVNVARKFYDSLHWLFLKGKDKPKKYVYVVEYPSGNSTSRLLLRNKLKEKLPFTLQTNTTSVHRKIIDEVKVVDISEWNADAELGLYPIRPTIVSST